MAVVVLFSTTSFVISKHFCGDTLVDIAIFKKVETCGMEKKSSTIPKNCSIAKKNCCKDQHTIIDGQNELQLQVDKISFEQQTFVASFIYTYIDLYTDIDNNVFSFEEYVPPVVTNQIYKIDESYLI